MRWLRGRSGSGMRCTCTWGGHTICAGVVLAMLVRVGGCAHAGLGGCAGWAGIAWAAGLGRAARRAWLCRLGGDVEAVQQAVHVRNIAAVFVGQLLCGVGLGVFLQLRPAVSPHVALDLYRLQAQARQLLADGAHGLALAVGELRGRQLGGQCLQMRFAGGGRVVGGARLDAQLVQLVADLLGRGVVRRGQLVVAHGFGLLGQQGGVLFPVALGLEGDGVCLHDFTCI